MSRVILVRPGCTDFDEQRRIQGSLDLPLNTRGQCQLTRVLDVLREFPVEAVLTGPGDPCRSTARALGESLDVPVREKDELRNLDHGLWQGMSLDEVRRRFPAVWRQWEDAPQTVCPPMGETVAEALERISDALRKPLRKYDVVAVVASEPLASVVSSYLKGEVPQDLCASLFSCCEDHLVEVIETTGTDPDRSGCGEELPIENATL